MEHRNTSDACPTTRVLIIDLEASCSDDPNFSAELMETIEVGAVWFSEVEGVVDTFQRYVRPVERPQLTPFCISLTGIQQADVSEANTWPYVAAELQEFVQRYRQDESLWGSWGGFDNNQIQRDCTRHGVFNPVAELPHENFKSSFAKVRKIKQVGMKTALKILGLSIEGAHHRALSDALNITRLVSSCRTSQP